MKTLLAMAIATLLVSGCATQSFTLHNSADSTPNVDTSQHFFINGLAQERHLDAATICGGADKVLKVEVQQTFVNGLLSAVTFGIYTPRTARVYCQAE
jgi:uncharacterized lipoprotein YajG